MCSSQAALGYNITGLPLIHWRTRAISPQMTAAHAFSWNTSLNSAEFWQDWCISQFGPSAGPIAASIFESIDSFSTPRPVSWISGMLSIVLTIVVLKLLVLTDVMPACAKNDLQHCKRGIQATNCRRRELWPPRQAEGRAISPECLARGSSANAWSARTHTRFWKV